MTINEAHKICEDYYRLSNPNDEDRFLVTEALDYLITETKDPGYMLELGGLYYEQKQFELARKYASTMSLLLNMTTRLRCSASDISGITGGPARGTMRRRFTILTWRG